VVIQTQRLVIGPYTDSDRDSMIELLTNEQIRETFMLPDFNTIEEATDMFRKLKYLSYSDQHYERGIYRAGELIGFVNDVDIGDGYIEIGYVIHPIYQGMGYASEALSAVIGDLFRKGYREVRAAAFAGNTPSRRVMEKCGMCLTEKESSIIYCGQQQPCVHYAIVRY